MYYQRDGIQRLLKIDAKTFQVVSPSILGMSCRAGYAKDARVVLYEGERIQGAHVASFRPFPGWSGYARDRQRVYSNGKVISDKPDKFQVFGDYATDGDTVFCGAKHLLGKKLVSLGDYAKTEIAVYHRCEILGSLDPESFNVFEKSPDYGRDREIVVRDGKPIPGADPASFEIIAPGVYTRDRKHVYYRGEVIAGADSKTMEQISGYYFRDARAVCLEGQEIVGADPTTFRLTKFGNYAVDRARVYHFRNVLSDRDPATFEELQSYYSKDKNGVYYQGKLMPMADPATFFSQGGPMVYDKNYFYADGRPIQCLGEQAKREGKYCR